MKKILLILIFFFLTIPANALEGQYHNAFGFMYIKYGNSMFVYNVFKDSPAWNEIYPSDEILSINDKDVSNLTKLECQELLKNKNLNKVKFKIKRDNQIIVKEIAKRKVFISDYVEVTPKFYVNWVEHKMENNYSYIWLKVLSSPIFKNSFYDPNAVYAKKLWAFDCKNKNLAQVEHIEYYKDGTYYQAPSIIRLEDYEWSRVIPKTVSDEAYKLACVFFNPEYNN